MSGSLRHPLRIAQAAPLFESVPPQRAGNLSRKRCREMFEQRFQVARISQDYCDVYRSVRQQPCRRTA
jgi:hypothetical protein